MVYGGALTSTHQIPSTFNPLPSDVRLALEQKSKPLKAFFLSSATIQGHFACVSLKFDTISRTALFFQRSLDILPVVRAADNAFVVKSNAAHKFLVTLEYS